MPTYEYQCEKCDRTFEVAQSMKDEPLKSCPKDRCQRKTWGKGRSGALGTGAIDLQAAVFTPRTIAAAATRPPRSPIPAAALNRRKRNRNLKANTNLKQNLLQNPPPKRLKND